MKLSELLSSIPEAMRPQNSHPEAMRPQNSLPEAMKPQISLPEKINPDAEITSVCSDSSSCRPGSLFVAIDGLHRDGHSFALEALQNGASAFLLSSCTGPGRLAAFRAESALADSALADSALADPGLADSGQKRAGKASDPADAGQKEADKASDPSEAFQKMASRRALAETLISSGASVSFCSDTRAAEAYLASRLFGDPGNSLSLFAVTGTNGKTSVVSMLSSLFSSSGYSCRVIGTLTGHLTTPDPSELYRLLSTFRDSGVTHVFLEASSHALSFGKLAPLTFDYGIFTNLTTEHLDFHGDLSHYAAAKASLFRQCRVGIFNSDDPWAGFMASGCRRSIFCSLGSGTTGGGAAGGSAGAGYIYKEGNGAGSGGKSGHGGENQSETGAGGNRSACADFLAENIRLLGLSGSEYLLRFPGGATKIRLGIPGLFNVTNSLLASSAALSSGIDPSLLRTSLRSFPGVRGRLERLSLPTDEFSVTIDFAHTPSALETVLLTLRSCMTPSQRLVLLFGCGGDRDRTKRPLMGEIATRLSDFVILTSDNSRSERTSDILSEIQSGIRSGSPYTVIENRRSAIFYAISSALPGDVILLAGKGHEEYEILPSGVFPFSERDIVFEAVSKRLKSEGRF